VAFMAMVSISSQVQKDIAQRGSVSNPNSDHLDRAAPAAPLRNKGRGMEQKAQQALRGPGNPTIKRGGS
jgi:hypothetical protein